LEKEIAEKNIFPGDGDTITKREIAYGDEYRP
jgi:hypothetical protein